MECSRFASFFPCRLEVTSEGNSAFAAGEVIGSVIERKIYLIKICFSRMGKKFIRFSVMK
uniref:Transposase n=1 Tax=Ascaris lumbricoides TaxID=6252 RepID=A0A0M3IXJ6_ASCLU